jgi:aspartokinase/homoserine dehydrogenase 1
MALGKDARGLDMDRLSELMADGEDMDLDVISEAMEADVSPLRIIIDCTNSETVSDYYKHWLSAGIHLISPSRKVAAGPLERFQRVRKAQRDNSVYWQYESSVGAALPIITTLKDLRDTGDKISIIGGCVSGTMAYVLSTTSESTSFSEAVRQSVELGYVENDFREDLSGEDAVRKVVILARQVGMNVNIEDVEVESLIPQAIIKKVYAGDKDDVHAQLLEDIKHLDGRMLQRIKDAEASDCVLRYKFKINTETGKCQCSLKAVPRTDPLFRLKANENLVAFETTRYKTSPLIVKGAAAGPDLAAAGIFADLLRVTRAYSSQHT